MLGIGLFVDLLVFGYELFIASRVDIISVDYDLPTTIYWKPRNKFDNIHFAGTRLVV